MGLLSLNLSLKVEPHPLVFDYAPPVSASRCEGSSWLSVACPRVSQAVHRVQTVAVCPDPGAHGGTRRSALKG